MKLLTLNFLTCARRTCKTSPSSFPLHPREAELEILESELNLVFLRNILPRLMWSELRGIGEELGLPSLPESPPSREDLVTKPSPAKPSSVTEPSSVEEEGGEGEEVPSQTAKDLHRLLLETTIKEGKLVCGNCGHEYAVKEGVANFLLPGHLV
ncbi:hypothetical protein BDV96DRAFT_580620 [Lophiotrema nucula]|uniref:Trm112p-domain-containing protein n=1 Tax=Lophiotrema nucula TaxID=690887 RepID=A0A6A5YZ38_9PLEO|nr:hypothetical protein BDV96DRAFT_580620 [Lophiotrema nucula]